MTTKHQHVRLTVLVVMVTGILIMTHSFMSCGSFTMTRDHRRSEDQNVKKYVNEQMRSAQTKEISVAPETELDGFSSKTKLIESTQYSNRQSPGTIKEAEPEEEHACLSELKNIAFLKTHKTASSTITNIIQRFGYQRNLTFVMPLKDTEQVRFNYIGREGETIQYDNIIPKPEEEEYNILCNHVTYNEAAFNQILPQDTFLFTIIREPLNQFISTLNYYGYSPVGYIYGFLNLNVVNPLSEYLQSPWKYEPTNPQYSMTNNKMSIDLGMPPDQIRNGSFIKSYHKKLNSKFKLVLLKEYFDESLVLLKRHTCWSFKDILYIKHNIWPLQREFRLTTDDINKHRKWNVADYALYESFFKIFWIKVFQQKDFFSEVLHFRRVRRKVDLHCTNDSQFTNLTILASKWSKGFTITPEDCHLIKMNESEFTKLIHHRMMQRVYPLENSSLNRSSGVDIEEKVANLF